MTQVQLERLEDRNETNQQRLKLIEEINENMIYEK